jgi:hypothetical protein
MCICSLYFEIIDDGYLILKDASISNRVFYEQPWLKEAVLFDIIISKKKQMDLLEKYYILRTFLNIFEISLICSKIILTAFLS